MSTSNPYGTYGDSDDLGLVLRDAGGYPIAHVTPCLGDRRRWCAFWHDTGREIAYGEPTSDAAVQIVNELCR